MTDEIFLDTLGEIETSLKNGCYLAALALALTIPDICGKAEYPESSVTKRYIKWFNEYYVKTYENPNNPYTCDMPFLNGEVLFNLRNSFLHQGTPNVVSSDIKEERCKVDKFILTINKDFECGTSMVSYSSGRKINYRQLEVNMVLLSERLVREAREYYNNNKEKFNFFDYTLNDETKK